MDKVKKRSEIPEKYKWDLSILVKEFVDEIQKYHGHLFDSASNLLEYLQKSTEMEKKLRDIYVWANLNRYEDLSSSKANDYVLKVTNLNNKMAQETAWVDTEIIAHDEKEFDLLLKTEPKLQEYAFIFQNLFRRKEHILTENEEKLMIA